jgi:hypothetical protein
MNKEALDELLNSEPFRPFRILTSCGRAYEVKNSGLVAASTSTAFYAYPNSERFALIPLLQVSSIELLEKAA